MQSKEQSLPPFDFEKEAERAKWFKDDLDKGGWTEANKDPGSTYWIKTFPDEEVPIKLLFKWNIPIPAKIFMEMLHPSTLEVRKKWDTGFVDHELLEEYPDGGVITFQRTVVSWPLTDRGFVLLTSPVKEIDWYGKQAYFMFFRNASHPSKPEGEDGLVRAYNGGNFYVAIPDESEPETACEVFGLSNNLFNGRVPDIECLTAKLVPKVFKKLRKNMLNGYKTYYAKEQK